MYNGDNKEKFFEYCRNEDRLAEETIKKYRANFNSIGRYEEAIDKDISSMSWEEIVNMFASCEIYKISYIRQIHSMLKKYVDWNNQLYGRKGNYFKTFTPKDIAGFFKESIEFSELYFTPEQWQEYIRIIRNRYDETNAIYFEGLLTVLYYNVCSNVKDIMYLALGDINTVSMTIRDKPVPKYVIQLLEKVHNLDLLQRKTRKDLGELNYSYEKESIFKWNSNGGSSDIYESFKPITRHFLRDEIKKVTGKKISSKTVYDCGLIHFLLQQYIDDGNERENFVEDLFSQKMDFKFNLWLSQKSSIGLSSFKYKYSDIIEYCI